MNVNEQSFGVLIAYIIPGWILLLGISYHVETVGEWVSGSVTNSATVGGFLFSTLASVGLGVAVSTLRWLVVDPVLRRFGTLPRQVGFTRLVDSYQAVTLLIEGHYRYYQFHSNLCMALPLAAVMRWAAGFFAWGELVGLVFAVAVLFAGAWDTFHKYHQRITDVLEG